MTTNDIKQQILEHLKPLPFEYGEIDSALNFQPLTEAEMIQQSKLALEDYRRKGSGVAHNIVREWADSLEKC
ncbi:hypothetical protein [Calothrix sp. CCY 0018]|uniref:hypothetical protein n=1 Tax=Calothrix sp. CCY 0018 TaxID=3103864 RepID=UPI0039C70BDB